MSSINLINIFKFTSIKTRYHLIILFFLILLVSMTEIVSLSAIYPYITMLINPNKFRDYLDNFILVDFSNKILFLYVSILFSFIIIITVTLRLSLLFFSTKISSAIGSDLSSKLYLNTLHSDYENHLLRNSNEVIDMIIRKSMDLTNYINSILAVISSIILIAGISIVLIYVDKNITLSIFLTFSVIYLLISIITKRKISNNSILVSKYAAMSIKILQDGLGSMRDILLDRNQSFYKKIYSDNDIQLKKALAENSFIGACPRYILEAIAMVVIVLLCYFMHDSTDGLVFILPTITVMVLGAQKLLPLFQAIYANLTILNSISKSVEDCKCCLEESTIVTYVGKKNYLEFTDFKKIQLSNLFYSYKNSSLFTLSNINIEISKGDRILILGESGSGKSTLINMIMGLLKPRSGRFIIDGVAVHPYGSDSWKDMISHVPQNVYISNASVMDNIALGVPFELLDLDRVKESSKLAGISEYIESLPDGYLTMMGENGGRFSGGQSQRIGIARALYKRSRILILDEATSSLDEATENEVITNINTFDKNLTILIVTHRSSLKRYCTKIWNMQNSNIVII